MSKYNKIEDKDFEVVEEIIEDFDYFYEDEADIIMNLKIKRKYKTISIIIAIIALFFICLLTGMIQMKLYNTKKIVTKEIILKYEYKEKTEEARNYIANFYYAKVETESGTKMKGEISKIINFLENSDGEIMDGELNDHLLEIRVVCEQYIGDVSDRTDGFLEKLELPDESGIKEYNEYLIDCYTLISNICDDIENNKEIPESKLEAFRIRQEETLNVFNNVF